MNGKERAERIKKDGATAQGKNELLAHLAGKKLTARQAIKAKCYDCMCYYLDGKEDCGAPDCANYGFMPYRTVKNAVRKAMPEATRQALMNARKKRGENAVENAQSLT
jgi:hypothetical protein